MSKKAVERVKTAAIVLLLISAVILGYFSNILPRLGGAQTPGAASGDPSRLRSEPGDAAMPMCIAVTGGDGAHYGEKYDDEALRAAFEKTANLLSEALGSAGEPAEADEAGWREFLTSPGLYYEYFAPVPMAVLCSWLGTEARTMESCPISALCLAGGRLCFRDGSGAYYECATAVPAAAAEELAGLCSEEAVFAFEVPVLESFGCGSQLLFTELTAHAHVTAEQPLSGQEARYALLEALDAAMFEKSGYMEGDGTYVYVATEFTLRIAPDGTVLYRRSGESRGGAGALFSDIEKAELMCDRLLSPFLGEADICYTDAVFADGNTTVHFDYNIAGGLLSIADGASAATVTLSGGIITEMRLQVSRFALSARPRSCCRKSRRRPPPAADFLLSYAGAGGEYVPRWTESRQAGSEG
jgi:hypothetical protein